MNIYKCNICNYKTKNKYNLQRHLMRKNPCKKLKKNNLQCVTNNRQKKTTKDHMQYIDKNDLSMKTHTCDLCRKTFKFNYLLSRHSKTCKGDSYIIKNEDNKFECKLCSRSYKHRYTTFRHLKKCKKNNKHMITLQQNQINNSNNKMNSDIHNSIVGSTISVTNNNIINILPFGKENMDIPNEIKKLILNKGFKAVGALTKYIHLNKNKPENHNLYKTNLKNKLLNVYNGDQWLVQTEDDVIDDVYVLKKAHLEEWFEELCGEITGITEKKINRFFDHSDDVVVANKIKTDIRLMLYNYKGRVLKTIKKTD